MSELSDIQRYLNSICDHYKEWWKYYTPTDAEGRQKQSPFDFGLIEAVRKGDRERQNEEKVERWEVLEGIRNYAENHVLLVGRPGSGKPTALARLLLEEATQQTSIPVLVELRYWQGSINNLIHSAFARHDLSLTAQQFETVLSRSLCLFDGVNELPSDEARSQLAAFRRDHPKLQMIFTTRDLNIGGDLGIEKQLEMQPLTEPQMQAFIRAYVPEQAEQMLRQLKDRLREFVQTPLLLWMLCGLFQQTGEIPENLGMVFRLFTQQYQNNLKQDVVIESDRAWWKPVLQQLAWTMMQGEKPTELRVAIGEEEAVRAIAQFLERKVPYAEDFARKCLRDLQKHHLIQAGTNQEELEFRHQLIQEYYAAEALLERLPELSDEVLKRENLNYLKWTDSIELLLALAEESKALRVVSLALKVDLILGGRLIRNSEIKDGQELRSIIENTIPSEVIRYWFIGIAKLNIDTLSLLEALDSEATQIRDIAIKALLRILPGVEGFHDVYELLESKGLLHIRRIRLSQIYNKRNDSGVEPVLRELSIFTTLDKSIKKLEQNYTSGLCRDIADATAVLGSYFDYDLIPIVLEIYRELIKDFQVKEISDICDRLVKVECESIVPAFLEALKSTLVFDLESFDRAFSKLKSSEFLISFLAEIAGSRAFELVLLNILNSLQQYCKYYNYEIYQDYLEAQNLGRQTHQNNDRSSPIIHNFPNAIEVKIFENVDRYYETPPKNASS